MFRDMRRSSQQLDREQCEEILARASWGVLAVLGDEGYPYTVALNHVYLDGALYFHCATSGHKLDAIRACDKVSFCVVDADDVVPQEYTTYFRSVVAFGRARVVEDEEEKARSLRALGNRFNPDPQATDVEAAHGAARLHMVRIDIEHLSGKQAKELVKRGEGERV